MRWGKLCNVVVLDSVAKKINWNTKVTGISEDAVNTRVHIYSLAHVATVDLFICEQQKVGFLSKKQLSDFLFA